MLHKVWVLEQKEVIIIRYIVKEVGSKIRHLRNLSSIIDHYLYFFFLSIGFFLKKRTCQYFVTDKDFCYQLDISVTSKQKFSIQ